MIYKEVNFSSFCDSFSDSYKNNFTYEGKKALFEYLEQLSDDAGENIELDIIALCCEYTEYESFEELQKQYPNIEDFEDLNNHTTVIEVDNDLKDEQFIIVNF
jgi:hypothetical protein